MVFQGCSVFESFLLHVTHRSYPSRRRACFLNKETLLIFLSLTRNYFFSMLLQQRRLKTRKLQLNRMRAILSTLAMSLSVLGILAARETTQRPNLSWKEKHPCSAITINSIYLAHSQIFIPRAKLCPCQGWAALKITLQVQNY